MNRSSNAGVIASFLILASRIASASLAFDTAEKLRAQGRGQDAIPLFEKVIGSEKNNPDDPSNEVYRSYVELGTIYSRSGDMAKLVKLHERQLRDEAFLNPAIVPGAGKDNVIANLVREYRAIGKDAKASELADHFLTEYPDSQYWAFVFQVRNAIDENAGNDGAATARAEAVFGSSDVVKKATAAQLLINLAVQRKAYLDALKVYRQALLDLAHLAAAKKIDVDSLHADDYARLGRSFDNLIKLAESRDAYIVVFTYRPAMYAGLRKAGLATGLQSAELGGLWRAAGDCYSKADMRPEAIASFSRALKSEQIWYSAMNSERASYSHEAKDSQLKRIEDLKGEIEKLKQGK